LAEHDVARAADRVTYLAKFPEAEPITALGDFAFFRLEITGGRLVSGFGGAINLSTVPCPLCSPSECRPDRRPPINERQPMSL
jgi:hypothetical protein